MDYIPEKNKKVEEEKKCYQIRIRVNTNRYCIIIALSENCKIFY